MTRNEWLGLVCPIAVRMERLYGFPAQVLVAHWAVECGWGSAIIGKHNYFGMKRARRHQMWVDVPRTKEWFSDVDLARWRAKNPGRKFELVQTDERPPGPGKRLYVVSDQFADYPTLEQAALDYIHLLTCERGPYAQAWLQFRADGDVDSFVRNYIRVYATADKADLVSRIARQRNVIEAVSEAAEDVVTTK